MSPAAPLLERNLVVYGRYQVAAHLLFWLPTSVLYFSERTDLGTALGLWAAYFLAVVVAEVPSGWFSDRVSRVATLRLSALFWVLAAASLSVAGSSVPVLFLGQVLVALGFAFRSGTDTALHYDTLEALGREDEFERREARASRNGFVGTTAAVVIGGLLGTIDLRLPYVAWSAAAVAQLVATQRLTEPPRPADARDAGAPRPANEPGDPGPAPSGHVRTSLRQLRHPALAWLFVFMIVQQPLEGLALDLMQPWLTLLTGNSPDDPGSAPLLSGALLAVVSVVGAAAAGFSPRVRARLGTRPTLVTLASVEAFILVGMAVVASPWLLPVLALRSTQTAAASVIVAAASAPHLAKSLRATFLSLGSLAGRLAYGLVLLGLGRVDDVETLLRVGGGVGIVSVLVLLGAGAVLPPRIDARAGDPSAAPGRDAAAAAGAPPDGPRKPARPWRSGPRRWR